MKHVLVLTTYRNSDVFVTVVEARYLSWAASVVSSGDRTEPLPGCRPQTYCCNVTQCKANELTYWDLFYKGAKLNLKSITLAIRLAPPYGEVLSCKYYYLMGFGFDMDLGRAQTSIHKITNESFCWGFKTLITIHSLYKLSLINGFYITPEKFCKLYICCIISRHNDI